MIERETVTDSSESFILLRFVRTGEDGKREVKWASSTEIGYRWKDGRRVPNRSWFTLDDRDVSRERMKGPTQFENVAWARRFSKIVREFKDLIAGGWEAEVVEVTDKRLHTREIKPRWPADAVEALADLGRDVADAG